MKNPSCGSTQRKFDRLFQKFCYRMKDSVRSNSLRRGAKLALLCLLIVPLSLCEEAKVAKPLGIFENHDDIGTVLHTCSAIYDSKSDTYTVSSSGEDMWLTSGDFHFVWKKASGKRSIAADITIMGHTRAPHRKAMLMIRQSLVTDSPYVDLAQHGVENTSLQFRDAPGAISK
ncbi:MAG: hypothetical protein P4L87_19840 [Formivibrio sp.]|nr:hypothetical protein [Formivibrio sp.]